MLGSVALALAALLIAWLALRVRKRGQNNRRIRDGLKRNDTGSSIPDEDEANPSTTDGEKLVVAYMRLMGAGSYIVKVRSLEIAREIMVNRRDNYVRWIPFIPKTTSLFPSEGDIHVRHKKVVGLSMRKEFVGNLNDTIVRKAHSFQTEMLSRALTDGETVLDDTYKVILGQVSNSILELTYGDTPEGRAVSAGSTFERTLASMLMYMVPVLQHLPIPSIMKQKKLKGEATRLRKMMIADVEENGEESKYAHTMLGLLVRSNLSVKESMKLSTTEIVGNAFGFGVGGNDSTASGLTTALYALARNQDVQQRTYEELAACGVDLNDPTSRLPRNLPYLDAVVKEAERLYPPFPAMIFRYAQEDDADLCGYHIPEGTGLMVDARWIHEHDTEGWGDDAASFRPERHLRSADSDAGTPSSNHFLTFGIGPRSCIGRQLALSLTREYLARILSEFRLTLCAPQRKEGEKETEESNEEDWYKMKNGNGVLVPSPQMRLRFSARA
eukprot:TRINITY_DN2918_c0_g1_i3.p1 TRINITY_DN2918_c0_g1~~TRINITY_DN2918_c0_g1_i3.p1  ORF type:complete len:499 (-),score=83.09 TRINITY_DN2918_c0_g1_i3:56-1552(-)